MPIRTVACRGYRTFSEYTEIDLEPLTVIFGKNNSGKTTLTRLPSFVVQSVQSLTGYASNGKGLHFGGSYREIVNHNEPHPSLDFWITFADGRYFGSRTRAITSELRQTIQVRLESSLSGSRVDTDEPGNYVDAGSAEHLTQIGELRADVDMRLEIIHVPSLRKNIQSVYPIREPQYLSEEEAPYLLCNDAELLDRVSEWFQDHFEGMTIGVERGTFSFRLVTSRSGNSVALDSVGRGYQSLLPVVVLLIAATMPAYPADLIVVEEPEAHLHPSAHASVGELLMTTSKSVQVIVETHSENAILRIRRRIAEETFPRTAISLVFVDDDQAVSHLEVAQNGGVENWPRGVFEYDMEEARAIVDAKLKMLDKADGP